MADEIEPEDVTEAEEDTAEDEEEPEGDTAEDEEEPEGDTAEDEEEPEGDTAEDERLLFGEKREETALFVGNSLGVTRVDVAAAQVGQFSLVSRDPVRSLAAADGTLVVATDSEVHVTEGGEMRSTGFGVADAVGIDDNWLYAADGERVARRRRPVTVADETEWETVGTVAGPRRFDGDLLAADKAVRIGDRCESLELDDVRDISRPGPLAATVEGLFEYDDGEWNRLLAGEATAVIADGRRAHAIVDGNLFERENGSWEELSLPTDATPLDIAYGQTLAVIDESGTVHVAADPELTHDGHGGWRSQALGLRDITAFLSGGTRSIG